MYTNKNLTTPIIYFIAVLLLVSLACGSSPVVSNQPATSGAQVQVVNSPVPFNTSLPTDTPLPTNTPLPSNTPGPQIRLVLLIHRYRQKHPLLHPNLSS